MTLQPLSLFDDSTETEALNERHLVDDCTDVDDLAGPFVDVTDQAAPAVQVTRSKRSRKTVSARFKEGVIHVTIPAWMTTKQEHEWVSKMVARFERSNRNTDGDLLTRAQRLCSAYDLPKPASVVWTRELTSLWGSCSTDTGAIRINGKLTKAPTWVLDYVMVHELAHLLHADHSPAFWEVVARYPKSERAIGFLMGMGFAETDG
jgi:predicted metal-dependent hydrolase